MKQIIKKKTIYSPDKRYLSKRINPKSFFGF